MSIVLRSFALSTKPESGGDTGSEDTIVPYPAGVVAGDLLLIQLVAGAIGSIPSGWTQLYNVGNSGDVFRNQVLYKIAGTGEPSSVAIPTSSPGMAAMSAWSGVDSNTPIDVYSTANLATSGNSAVMPTVTTTKADAMVLRLNSVFSNGSTLAPPAGYTEVYDTFSTWFFHGLQLAYILQNAIGASGPATATVENNPLTGGMGATIALAPSSVPTLPKAVRIKAAAGWVDLSQGIAKDQIFDAKGDLVVGTGPDAASKLPVGSNNQILVADSTQAAGIKWSTLASGGAMLLGTGPPGAGLGVENDLYEDISTGALYQKQNVLPAPVQMGQTTQSGEVGVSISPDQIWLNRYSLVTGLVNPKFTKLRIKLNGTVGAGEPTRVVLYASDGASNAPGTRLAEHEFITTNALEVQEFTLPAGVNAPNDDYYLGFHNKNIGQKYMGLGASAPTIVSSPNPPYGTSSPNPAGTFGAEFTSYLYDIQAEVSGTGNVQWILVRPGDTRYDAKGDILVGTANDTVGRLPAGSNNQVLTADSAQASGMKWAAAGGGALVLLSDDSFTSQAFDKSGISGAYNDLVIIASLRSISGTGQVSGAQIRLSNDATANYHVQDLKSQGAVTTAEQWLARTAFLLGAVPNSSGSVPTNVQGFVEMTIFGYSGNAPKLMQFKTFGSGSFSSNGLYYYEGGGIWNSTAPVDRIQIYAYDLEAFASGRVRIYGRT